MQRSVYSVNHSRKAHITVGMGLRIKEDFDVANIILGGALEIEVEDGDQVEDDKPKEDQQ